MKGRVTLTIALIGLMLGTSGAVPTESLPTVDLQPLGTVNTTLVEVVRVGMEASFAVRVRVLPSKPLPDSAWYAPRKRYRADRLLEFLLACRSKDSLKTVGLTQKDISIPKGTIPDWGIFGLGLLGGDVCVVSSHRLGESKVPREKFEGRLVKVANHELGHTLGLEHCATDACLMEDAAGTIKTVDAETGAFCPTCRARLGKLLRKR
jgi:archaemetzincin